jgi:hypothetical protein
VSLLEINNLENQFLEILLYFTIGFCVGDGKPKLTSTKIAISDNGMPLFGVTRGL